MYAHQTTLRVRYADTDRMDQVYYGRYAEFFEMGRVEAMRNLGISYRELEEMGVLLPVIEWRVRYLLPLTYDELLRIETIIPEMPTARIRFLYRILNSEGRLAADGETTLVFVRANDRRVIRSPHRLREALAPYFKGGDQ